MEGGIVILAGLVVGTTALLGRAGRIPRSHFVGIRLPSTMKSDEAWKAAHRASWPYLLVGAFVFLVIGVDLVIDPDTPPPVGLFLVGVLPPFLAAAITAGRAAKAAEESRHGG